MQAQISVRALGTHRQHLPPPSSAGARGWEDRMKGGKEKRSDERRHKTATTHEGNEQTNTQTLDKDGCCPFMRFCVHARLLCGGTHKLESFLVFILCDLRRHVRQ